MNKGSVYVVVLLTLCLAASAAAFILYRIETNDLKEEIAALKQPKQEGDAVLSARVEALENALNNSPKYDADKTAFMRIEREIDGIKRTMAARAEKPAAPIETKPGEKTDAADAATQGNNPAVENIKEEVKKELQAEEKQRKAEQRLKQAEQTRKFMQTAWETKMKEEFPKLAEKIKLSVVQEEKIKEIVDGAFNKIMGMLDEQFKLPEGEEKWNEFMTETQNIYKDAETQIRGMVSDEQAKELDEFFKKDRW